jgi:cytochrome c-type biogenesis protein CcmE
MTEVLADAQAKSDDLTPVEPPKSSSRSRWRSIVVITLMVGVVMALLAQGLLHNLNYFETVGQAERQRTTLGISTFRLEGVVAKGTIHHTIGGATFFLNGPHPREVYVVATGQPPQLFQANIPVVVEGHFLSLTSNQFDASQVIVKHSANYIAQHPNRVRAPNGTVR